MSHAYGQAETEILRALASGGSCLDCGATNGYWYHRIASRIEFPRARYLGIEWNSIACAEARQDALNVIQGDLNLPLPFESGQFRCVFALSLIEHLLNGCRFLSECQRVLEPGGSLVILTPNISTFFTAALILMGKMPSSGPHPDSEALLRREEPFRVRDEGIIPDVESDTPVHRHLVVFSFRVLREYLRMIGFDQVRGYGFGLYPFPIFLQPLLERVDPWHCHQMVFVAKKRDIT